MLKGKITPEEISELRALGLPMSKLSYKGEDVVFTFVTKRVVDNLRQRAENGVNVDGYQEEIFDSCVVWPTLTLEEKLKLPAGYIPNIAHAILEASGFVFQNVFGQVISSSNAFIRPVTEIQGWEPATDKDIKRVVENNPGMAIHHVKVGRFGFLVKPLTRQDLIAVSLADDITFSIAKKGVLWPELEVWENLPYGLIDMLKAQIEMISGVSDNDEITIERL